MWKRLLLAAMLVVPGATAAAEPPLSHRTSWLAETLSAEDAAYIHPTDQKWPGYGRKWVQVRVAGLFVDPQATDGLAYTNSVYDEYSREKGVYRFGDGAIARPVAQLYPQGSGGTVVTGDEKYFYADHTRWGERLPDGSLKNLGQVLTRFQRGMTPHKNPWYGDTIPMADFPGGDPVASGWTAGRNLTGVPGGLAAGLGFVFVARPSENLIYVYEREKMALVAKHPARNPGALTFRHATNSLFALSDNASGKREVREWKVQPSGAVTAGATIADVGATPVALAANANRLLIADNHVAAQQVRIHSETNQLIGKLGQPGGVLAHKGIYGDDRFDNLTGVGIDQAGNITVAANGRGTYGWLDIRRFNVNRVLDSKVVNHVFLDAGVPDPRDPSQVYTAFNKYSLNYAATQPGQEWLPNRTQLTVNRATCPHDGRSPHPTTGATTQTQAVAVRYLKDSTGVERKYLFVRPQGQAYTNLGIYRFEGDDVRPSVLFSEGAKPWPDGTPATPGLRQKWVDSNADCRINPGEITNMAHERDWISYAQSIDLKGGVWGTGVNPKYVHHFPLKSFDAAHNPQYGSAENILLADAPMDKILMVQYVDATDTMYLYGYRGEPAGPTASPRYILAKYDDFSTPQRKLSRSIDMNYKRCWYPDWKIDPCAPLGLAVAGNRVYVADSAPAEGEPEGRVRTYSADTLTYRGSLSAGPEVGRRAGWLDVAVTGITAAVLPNGEHVVFREEDALTRVLIYRYTPTG
ncbi:NHL repeat-containing protein [Allokutzneria albata]|uniref:LVIVD repeat-containing protein n=1 Tax=Allokutzneria albata TaxID=211114 RepID=A0A1H0CRC3_ALLAB|nr:hypothetical protein [Allokutzneria albata]SDN60449.1 hypothetical protein SAMN04489726_7379 [Allokutzneria albata]